MQVIIRIYSWLATEPIQVKTVAIELISFCTVSYLAILTLAIILFEVSSAK